MTHATMPSGGFRENLDAKTEHPINFDHDSFLEMKVIIQLSRLIL
jgi:hypothetical protein